MKTQFFSFLIMLTAAYSLNAQTVSRQNVPQETLDSAYIKCSYTLHFVVDPQRPQNVTTEEMALLIGRNVSSFFSYTRFQHDSLMANLPPEQMATAILQANSNGRSGGRFTYELFKNYPEGQITTTDRIAMNAFKYEEPYELPEWEILPETKVILGYNCQKATTSFRGRDYVAWFTPDIPISNGPWKFAGLPGLILNIADTQNHYVFECSGIETPTEKLPITMRRENYATVSKSDFNRVYERFLRDPMGSINLSGGSGQVTTADGQVVNVQAVGVRRTDTSGSPTSPASTPYNPIELVP